MDKFEKLVKSIMKDAEADGEPLTREEAEEVAEMEMRAKGIHRHEGNEPKPEKEKKARERRVDAEKGKILQTLSETLRSIGAEVTATQTETKVDFDLNGVPYTLQLIKHRPKK